MAFNLAAPRDEPREAGGEKRKITSNPICPGQRLERFYRCLCVRLVNWPSRTCACVRAYLCIQGLGTHQGVQRARMTFTCKMNECTATGGLCAPVHTCDHAHDMHRCVAAHTTPHPSPHPSYPIALFFFYFSICACLMSLHIVMNLTLFMQLCARQCADSLHVYDRLCSS